jgi:uncharacterized protein YukE
MAATDDDPGGERARTVSLDSLRLLGEAVNALRVAADALGSADARFAGAAHGLGRHTGDGRLGSQYDAAFANTRRTLRTLQDSWQRLARGLDAVADAYAEGGPPVDTAGGP